MRVIATGLLLVMAICFILLRRFEGPHPAWGYALAFTEAAMVGGLADWFAVTALFRRPLGLPIPHTAIIPVNKDRIADTMAGFLRDNFLTPQVVARRIGSFNFAAAAGGFLLAPGAGVEGRLRGGAANLIADMLEALDPERLGKQVRAGLWQQLAKLDVAPLLGRMIDAAIADRKHLPLIEAVIRKVGGVLEENEEMVRTMVRERSGTLLRLTGIDERIANKVLDGVYKLLAEMIVIPDHPVRRKIEEGLEDMARESGDRPGDARAGRARQERAAGKPCGRRLVAAGVGAHPDRADQGRARSRCGACGAAWQRACRTGRARCATIRHCRCRSTALRGARWWAWCRAMATRSCGWSPKR